MVNIGAGIAGDSSSLVSYTTSGEQLPARDRPFSAQAYDPPNTIPGQLTLSSTTVTDRQRQDLFRLMSTVTYEHTARHGQIPQRAELARLFANYYQGSFVPPPAACMQLFEDLPDTPAGWVKFFGELLPACLADGETTLRFFSLAQLLPEGIVNWAAGATDDPAVENLDLGELYFRADLTELETGVVMQAMVSYLYNSDAKTCGIAEYTNLALLRVHRPTRCLAHFLDCRPILGHGPGQCINIRCKTSSPGCLLSQTSIIGFHQPALLVCQLLSRSGISSDRRGTLRTLYEVAGAPGYTKQALMALMPFTLTLLDQNTILRATNSHLRPIAGEALLVSCHPCIPCVGTTVRVLFPNSAKHPDAPVIIHIFLFLIYFLYHDPHFILLKDSPFTFYKDYDDVCHDQATILALCAAFDMGAPICFGASGDLAFELTSLTADTMSLFHFYTELLLRVDDFTRNAKHRKPLPLDVPKLPLPACLAPGGKPNFFLKRNFPVR
ncbi:unnamed protein product [Oikopleura dioica]|uniref:Uncharacterized protein n=1 Tax=Oikopleura dioica TaxID=34765 RepID=E4YVP7_OIKDI|nr:unnamed protein product [Oikopleura dioica]